MMRQHNNTPPMQLTIPSEFKLIMKWESHQSNDIHRAKNIQAPPQISNKTCVFKLKRNIRYSWFYREKYLIQLHLPEDGEGFVIALENPARPDELWWRRLLPTWRSIDRKCLCQPTISVEEQLSSSSSSSWLCVFLLYTNREEKMLACSRFSEGEGVFFINPPEVCINSKKDPGL